MVANKMFKNLTLAIVLSIALIGCGKEETKIYTIADCEKIGFVKEAQQIFILIGANNGWSGTWEGEVVEVYSYDTTDSTNGDKLNNAAAPGNASGWVELSRVENIVMLSKGKKAGEKLRTLLSGI